MESGPIIKSVSIPQISIQKLLQREEYSTFLVWAYPELINWPRKFEWLFSPVVGKEEYPGDLWGIDEEGHLLILETKLGVNKDPFEDFIEFDKSRKWESDSFIENLIKRWANLYKLERKFWKEHEADLRNRNLGEIKAKGIVPYSRKRFATRDFSELYLNVMVPHLFGDEEYSKNVNQFLETSYQSRTRTTHYFGLVFVKDPSKRLISAKGERHQKELEALAGKDRVNLMWMTAEEIPANRMIEILTGINQ